VNLMRCAALLCVGLNVVAASVCAVSSPKDAQVWQVGNKVGGRGLWHHLHVVGEQVEMMVGWCCCGCFFGAVALPCGAAVVVKVLHAR